MLIISITVHFHGIKLYHSVPLNEAKWCTCLDCFIVNELRDWRHFCVIEVDFYAKFYADNSSMIESNGLEWQILSMFS